MRRGKNKCFEEPYGENSPKFSKALLLTPAAWPFSLSFVWANSTPLPPGRLAFQEKQVGGDTSLGKQKISELWPCSSCMARKSLPGSSWSPREAIFLYFQAEMHMQRTVLLFYLILFSSSLFLTPPMYNSQLTFFFLTRKKQFPPILYRRGLESLWQFQAG